jgi:hypothetical protein
VGIPVIDGRGIRAEDDASRPRTAVIDETLAGRLWPGDEAVGRRLRIGDDSAEVVGVARAVRRPGGRPVAPTVYLPLAQHPTRRVHLVARSNDGIAAGERLEEAVRGLLPGGSPPAITPLAEVLQVVLLPQRVAAAVAGALGLLALLLAAVGLHALMALLVRRRRRELAVRLALGAMPSGLFREVARRGLGLSLIGLTAGLFLGGAAGGTLRGFLVGVGPADPGALVVPLLAVGTAALLAVWLPARRASRIDPMAALREE